MPPSNKNRSIQPVFSIATEFGKRFNINLYLDALEQSSGNPELKSIKDPEKRLEALRSSMHISKNYNLSGKNVMKKCLLKEVKQSFNSNVSQSKVIVNELVFTNLHNEVVVFGER